MDTFFKYLILLTPLAVIVIAALKPVRYKLKAGRLGVKISWNQVFSQSTRKTLTDDLLEAAALAKAADFDVDIVRLEMHKLAGGNPIRVIQEMIEARRKGEFLEFNVAAVIDLGRKDQ